MSHYPEGCIEPEDRANWDHWQREKEWQREKKWRAEQDAFHVVVNDPWTTTGTRKGIKVTPEDEEPF